jgi:hypothetical protein
MGAFRERAVSVKHGFVESVQGGSHGRLAPQGQHLRRRAVELAVDLDGVDHALDQPMILTG